MTIKEPGKDPKKPTSRLDAELAEILERADRPPSNVIKFRAKARTTRSRLEFLKAGIPRPGTGVLLAASIGLALIGSLVHDSSRLAAVTCGWISIGCFAAVLFIGYRAPSGPASQRWRGRDVTFGNARPTWFDRFKPPKH